MEPRIARRLRLGIIVTGLVALVALAGFTYVLGGPSMLIGMLRYDQREEGRLRVGDPAPDVALTALDGAGSAPLLADRDGKALVIVFGSFT